MSNIVGIGLHNTDFPIIKSDQDLIIENVKRVLLTLPGEQVGNLNFGCRLREYLFEFEKVLEEDIEQVIISAISTWEPRVVILGVDLKIDPEMKELFHVTVSLTLRETLEKFNLSLPITF